MNVNLNLYKYFYEIAKHNSFTKAANELLISQPSLSYNIKVLEEELGYKLFSREKGKIKLTFKGEKLYQKLCSIFEIIDTMGNDNDIKGDVMIGIRPLLAINALPAYVNQIIRVYPNININYKMRSNEELIEGLKNGEFDLIFDEYNYKNNDIISIPCKTKGSKSGFVMATKYYEELFIDKDYLKNNTLLISSVNKYSKDFIDKYNITKFDEATSTPILVEKLLHQKQIAFSNLFVLQKEINNGLLKVLPTDLDLPETSIYISYNKKEVSNRGKAIIDFFKNYNFDEIEMLNEQNEDK